jgi:hypothetical protein
VDVLRRNVDTIAQIFGVLIISIGAAIISIAAGLIVLGSLTLAYGTIREVVHITTTQTEDAEDDGVR